MSKANLMLHTGASAIDRNQLSTVVTPSRTPTWVPIPHIRLLNEVSRTLEQNHLRIVNESHGLSKDGNRYFGLLQVENGESSNDFGIVLGLRNSHDKAFPVGFVVGGQVFVCDNLSFSSEIKIARKHTVWVERDLPQLITRAMGQLGSHRRKQEIRFEHYKKTELNNSQVNDFLIRALDSQIMPVPCLPKVLHEWREPKHAEFKERTAWSLFNSFTEALKDNLQQLPKRTQALHGLLDVQCGLLQAT